jgi:hypothetical protein
LGVLLGSIQLTLAQPILSFASTIANAIETSACPTLALVQRLHTFQGLGRFRWFLRLKKS